MVENKIISPNQIGFQRGYRTADYIYLLKTLVTKVLRKRTKLYAAFIDFKKAYDTVDRSILLKCLHRNGVQGPFLQNLKAMYQQVRYAIKLNSGIMEPIMSNLGLKQGCPLSPLLFNVYINDQTSAIPQKLPQIAKTYDNPVQGIYILPYFYIIEERIYTNCQFLIFHDLQCSSIK